LCIPAATASIYVADPCDERDRNFHDFRRWTARPFLDTGLKRRIRDFQSRQREGRA
jgi:hypothetical protein